MKTQQLTSNAESRMAVERESLTQTIQVMLKTFTIWLMLMPISFIAQIQVGTDVQNAVTILMNTDSVYSQNRSYGWLKFNANTTSNISGNIFNIKAVVIRTPVSATTVKVRIVNLYDNGLNLIASDTLHTGDTLMVFTASVSANQWYYLQTIANYPCDTCVYNEAVSFEMNLQPLSNNSFTCLTPNCILTITTNSNNPGTQSLNCELVCNGNMNNVDISISTTLSVNTHTTTNDIPGVTGWVTPTPHTPDYFNIGASPIVNIPCNGFGNQVGAPSSAPGDGYLGIIWGYYLPNSTQDYTEYIEAPLLSPLIAGKNYIISFMVSKADYAGYKIPALAVYLTPNLICEPNNLGVGILSNTNVPVFIYTNTVALNDPNNWQLISFCYTAQGGEQYITIGRPNIAPYNQLQYNIGTTPPVNNCSTPSPFPNIGYYAYLFIDNVSVIPIDVAIITNTNNCTMSASVTPCLYDPNNANLFNNISYQWTPITGLTSPNSSVTSVSNTYAPTYSLTITYSGVSGTCSVLATTTNVPLPPNISISASHPTICPGYSSTLTATGAINYTWLPANATGSTFIATPSITTIYTVIASGTNACTSSQTIQIFVDNTCCAADMSRPVLYNCTLVPNGYPGAIPLPIGSGLFINQNISIPTTGIITGAYNINGHLYVNTSTSFSSADLRFGEASQIIQNQPLMITNSYLHACNKMWKGIISNNSLNIQHSFIEDAQTAVQTNIPNHPGVSLNDVLFNKNYTAVSIGNTINASSLNNFRVTNCIFTSRQIPSPTSAQLTSTLLWRNIPPYTLTNLNTTPTGLLLGSTILGIPNTIRSQNGIIFQLAKFSNNTPLVVGQWTNNHAQINIFDHLGNSAVIGIFGSNFRLIDNYFNNFQTGPDPAGALHKAVTVALSSNATVGYSPYQGFSAMTNTFVACLTGVYATANASLTVTNNSFVSNSIGVEIDQLGQNNQINYVVKNQFQNCNFDVKSTNNKAILLQVNDNTSTYTPPALSKLVPVYNVYAIEPSISALVGYTVNGNDFRGKRVGGVYFQNIAKSYISSNYIEMVPSVGGTNYVSNIGLENTQNISVTDNTLTCNPSSTSNWNNFGVLNSFGQNNEFCGNQINKLGICMKHQGTSPSIITNNIFNNNTSDKALIGIWLALNGFIGDIEYNTANIQHAPAGNIFGNKKMPLSTQYDFQIADTYVSNFSTASKIYINSFPLFNNLYIPLVNSYDPASCSNLPPTCSPFSVISSSYPNQFATCVNLPNTLKISPGVPQFINNPSSIHYDPNVRRSAEKSVFEFIRKNSINTNGFPNANNFMITENTSAHGTFITIDSLAQLYVKTSNPAWITQAKNLNNAINPQYPSDFTQKNFNEVYLTFLQNDSLINTTHIDTLRSIAGRCPFTHGTAVYQARALLSKYDTLAYYNGCEITNITNNHRLMSQMVEEDESLLPLMLYPNPTKEYVAVYAPKYSVMYLMDITGKVVLQTEMKETTSRLVDIKNLSNGIYLYKIIKDDRVLKTDKLVIMGNE